LGTVLDDHPQTATDIGHESTIEDVRSRAANCRCSSSTRS